MHQPAEISRQLLRFWSRQNHAEVEGMKESTFGDPAASFDQLFMHDRDLTGGPAEADESQFQPESQCFPERNGFRKDGPVDVYPRHFSEILSEALIVRVSCMNRKINRIVRFVRADIVLPDEH